MDFRVVVSDPQSGKAYQVELKDPGASKLLGKKIGDKIEGDVLGMPGYSIQVTPNAERSCSPKEWATILPLKERRRG
ncbi:MAG: small subunit ribosomal protein S6e [Methanosaeta sp. ASP1-1]|nr:MAG: small subunit ribosomal protein S6e [Methanosaeta sp. ASP1-1]